MNKALTCSTLALCLFLPSTIAPAQSLTFNTFAGYAGQGNSDGSRGNGRFNVPAGVAADANGNVYVADTANHTIRKISPLGSVSTLAGLAGFSGTNDGSGTSARFNLPQALAVDAQGNVYVADTANHTIRKVTSAGLVSTLAGTPGTNGYTDGTGRAAQFNQPAGLAIDANGILYVADSANFTIRKVTSAGAVTTLAGSVGTLGSADGTNGVARFNWPVGLAADTFGNVYVADYYNHAIRRLAPSGTDWVASTLAGLGGVFGGVDGTNSSARFFFPQGLAVDAVGNVYVAEAGNQTIRKITPTGSVTTLAGSVGSYGSADGSGPSAQFRNPQALAFAGANLFVADTGNGTIRQMTLSGAVTTLAGSPSVGATDGAGSNGRFSAAGAATVDSSGNIYVADTENSTIRKITPAGAVITLAGLAGRNGSADGTGSTARFSSPQGVAVDAAGNIYVADTANHTIRKVTAAGVVTTLAGLPGTSGVLDGGGSTARFYEPEGLACDSSGNLYVADTWNHTIRQVTSAGVVSTLAGLAGNFGTNDGTGSGARFYEPQGVTVDSQGNVYVADTANHTLRKITSAGVVTTLAGSSGVYASADGTGANARFYAPAQLGCDGAGNVYVADYFNQTLRKVTPGGVVTTVAGLAGTGGSADGTGAAARFSLPACVAIGTNGAFYAVDSANNTLRLGALITNGAPAIVAQPQSQTLDEGSTFNVSVSAVGSPAPSYQWRFNSTNISGATGSSYSRPGVLPTDAGSYSVVVANANGNVTSADAQLTVNGAPLITGQPQNQNPPLGQSATFSVGVMGAQPLSYQWLFNAAPIQGATNASFSLVSPQAADDGSYSVLVTNAFGFAYSSSALLSVIVLPQAWGDSTWNQTEVPLSAGRAIAIAAGAWHNLALGNDGSVAAWGKDDSGQCDVPASVTNSLAIAAGGYHSLAIRANGTVAAWGGNSDGQTTVPAGLKQVIGVAAGTWFSAALRADGTVVAWGDNTYGQCNVPGGLTNVIAIAAGGGHCLALRANGSVVGWGENTDSLGNYSGQATPPVGLANVLGVSAGDYHSLAVLSNGTVIAWGDNSQGEHRQIGRD
jgi:sugar lactone lactonase YvrE